MARPTGERRRPTGSAGAHWAPADHSEAETVSSVIEAIWRPSSQLSIEGFSTPDGKGHPGDAFRPAEL